MNETIFGLLLALILLITLIKNAFIRKKEGKTYIVEATTGVGLVFGVCLILLIH